MAFGTGTAIEDRSETFTRILHLQEVLQAQTGQLKLKGG